MRGKKKKVATAIIILRSILGKSLPGSRKPKLSNGPAEAKGHGFTALLRVAEEEGLYPSLARGRPGLVKPHMSIGLNSRIARDTSALGNGKQRKARSADREPHDYCGRPVL